MVQAWLAGQTGAEGRGLCGGNGLVGGRTKLLITDCRTTEYRTTDYKTEDDQENQD